MFVHGDDILSDYDRVVPNPQRGPPSEFFSMPPSDYEKNPEETANIAPYKVECKVVNVLGRGVCAYGHEIGDTFIFEGDDLKTVKSKSWYGDICSGAQSGIMSEVFRYMWGGYIPHARGDQDNATGLTVCSDVKSLVVFQLRRIEKNPDSPYFKKK